MKLIHILRHSPKASHGGVSSPRLAELLSGLLLNEASATYWVFRTRSVSILWHRETTGNQQLAAERLGISRMTLRAKLKARNEEDVKE